MRSVHTRRLRAEPAWTRPRLDLGSGLGTSNRNNGAHDRAWPRESRHARRVFLQRPRHRGLVSGDPAAEARLRSVGRTAQLDPSRLRRRRGPVHADRRRGGAAMGADRRHDVSGGVRVHPFLSAAIARFGRAGARRGHVRHGSCKRSARRLDERSCERRRAAMERADHVLVPRGLQHWRSGRRRRRRRVLVFRGVGAELVGRGRRARLRRRRAGQPGARERRTAERFRVSASLARAGVFRPRDDRVPALSGRRGDHRLGAASISPRSALRRRSPLPDSRRFRSQA